MKFPDDVKKIIMRKFQRHHKDWLKLSVSKKNPNNLLVINLDIPTEQKALRQQESVRAWIESWKKCKSTSIIWAERNWRALGTQCVPEKLMLNQPSDAASWIEKTDDWQRAVERYKILIQHWPRLFDVLTKHYSFLADCGEKDFMRLIEMLKWLCANPASGLYPRQIPVTGIDSKWLESHKGLVSDLIAAIHEKNETYFYKACGLKSLPQLIRIRILDLQLRNQLGGLCDISIPLEEAANLNIKPANVFIVENLQTGLAFQDLRGSVVIMGLGYGVDVLGNFPWLTHARSLYWGDIDTHGFAILNRLRKYLPSLETILMDETTLLNHRSLWVKENKPHSSTDLSLLTDSEQKLFYSLKSNVWGQNIRLEQERICWDTAWDAVKAAVG